MTLHLLEAARPCGYEWKEPVATHPDPPSHPDLVSIFHHHRIDWSGHTNTPLPPCPTRHLSPKCFAETQTKIPANSNQAVMNRAMLKYQ